MMEGLRHEGDIVNSFMDKWLMVDLGKMSRYGNLDSLNKISLEIYNLPLDDRHL